MQKKKVSISSVQSEFAIELANLFVEKNLIQRIGPDKGGYWKVNND
jgi:hypothetical protein